MESLVERGVQWLEGRTDCAGWSYVWQQLLAHPDALPEGVREADLVIALLDEATGEWEFVTGVVDTDANTITFSIDHFTLFAILAAPDPTPTPTPAPAWGWGTGVWTGIGIEIAILAALLLVARRRIARFIRRIN